MADGGATFELAQYDAMTRAIAEVESVDEAKDIRDKTLALEAYYRQARNLDAERKVCNIRLRAERRVGELLKELARATPSEAGAQGGRGNEKSPSPEATSFAPSPYAVALQENGMSRQTASRFQALADMPAEKFEAALAAPEKPSTSSVVRDYREARDEVMAPKPRVSDAALTLWGHLRDFERLSLFDANFRGLLASMTDAMRADVLRIVSRLPDFATALEAASEPA